MISQQEFDRPGHPAIDATTRAFRIDGSTHLSDILATTSDRRPLRRQAEAVEQIGSVPVLQNGRFVLGVHWGPRVDRDQPCLERIKR